MFLSRNQLKIYKIRHKFCDIRWHSVTSFSHQTILSSQCTRKQLIYIFIHVQIYSDLFRLIHMVIHRNSRQKIIFLLNKVILITNLIIFINFSNISIIWCLAELMMTQFHFDWNFWGIWLRGDRIWCIPSSPGFSFILLICQQRVKRERTWNLNMHSDV